jgi:hypothetical protein
VVLAVVGSKSHLALLFAPKSSQKYSPVAGHVQARLAGALLEELASLDEVSTLEDDDSAELLASASLEATELTTTALDTTALETTALDELDFGVLLLEPPPQAVKAPAMQRLSNKGDVFMISPLLLLILRIVFW